MIKKSLYKLINSRSAARLILRNKKKSSRQIYYVKVDPNEISHISIISGDLYFTSGPDAVTGSVTGVFDLLTYPFKKDFMYQTVKDMLNGADLTETLYYRKLIKKKSHSETIAQIGKLTRIIQKLKNKGFLSQYELGKLDETMNIGHWKVPKHEIKIGMDRKGRLFRLMGGRHRLAVAQNIGIIEMPAILVLYHERSEHLLPDVRKPITGNPEDFKLDSP